MLERRIGQVLGVARQVDLAVATDNPPFPDQDRGVVAAGFPLLLGQLGITDIKADAELAGEVEQRPGFGAGHFALEKAVYLLLVGHPITREEGGQRELRKDHEADAPGMRLAHHLAQPINHGGPRVGQVNGAEQGDGRLQFTRHDGSPLLDRA